MKTKILITGTSGQIGSILTDKLQKKYGAVNVIASDFRFNSSFKGCFEVLVATNFDALQEIVPKY